MTNQIIIVVFSCLLSGLFTYFVTTIVSRRGMETIVKQAVEGHVESRHSSILSVSDIASQVERRVTQHELACNGNQRLMRIERAIIWLVVKQGGDLNDLGLGS